MVNDVGFVISAEGLASGPETRLDHSGLLYGRSYYSEKRQRKLLTQTSGSQQRVPLGIGRLV